MSLNAGGGWCLIRWHCAFKEVPHLKCPLSILVLGDRPCASNSRPETRSGRSEGCLEPLEGSLALVRRGDTVTVNYHGVVWGKERPVRIPTPDRHQPASFGIGVGPVIKGWDQTVRGHGVGSPPGSIHSRRSGCGSRGVPQAGISNEHWCS
ncbi:MAG: FKBP-type peptidyl-prolyl cis-trans isomerase [Weissella confusa]